MDEKMGMELFGVCYRGNRSVGECEAAGITFGLFSDTLFTGSDAKHSGKPQVV